jgi:hypothetical protein
MCDVYQGQRRWGEWGGWGEDRYPVGEGRLEGRAAKVHK